MEKDQRLISFQTSYYILILPFKVETNKAENSWNVPFVVVIDYHGVSYVRKMKTVASWNKVLKTKNIAL